MSEDLKETSIPRKWIYLLVAGLLGFLGWIFRSQNEELAECNKANRDLVMLSMEFKREKLLNENLKSIKENE
jgi:hypothetical protein